MRTLVVLLCLLLAASPYAGLYADGKGLPDANPLPFILGAVSGLGNAATASARAVAGFLGHILDWFIGDARAATRYMVSSNVTCVANGYHIASDPACWSNSTGGPGGAPVPVSTDTAVLDDHSGSATIYVDFPIAVDNWTQETFYGGVIHLNGYLFTIFSGGLWLYGGRFYADNSHLTMLGPFEAFLDISSNKVWQPGTSTVEFFSGSLPIRTPASGGDVTFYNLTVDTGVTASVLNSIAISNLLTLNGTMTITGTNLSAPMQVWLLSTTGLSTPLVFGPSGHLTGAVGDADWLYFFSQAGTLVEIPGATYTNIRVRMNPQVALGGDGFEYRLMGDLSSFRIELIPTENFFFFSQTYDLTMLGGGGGIVNSPFSAGKTWGIKVTSGKWTFMNGGCGNIYCTNFFMQLGSGYFYDTGPWVNNVTTNSAKWQAGTSTFEINSSVVGTGFIPAGYHLSVPEFYNLIVSPDLHQLNLLSDVVVAHDLILNGSSFFTNGHTVDAWSLTSTVKANFVASYGIVLVRHDVNLTLGLISMNFNVLRLKGATVRVAMAGAVGGVNLYSLAIENGTTATFKTYLGVFHRLWVNGTILANSPNDPEQVFMIFGGDVNSTGAASFVHIGLFADLSLSGYFVYRYTGPAPAFLVAGGIYQHLAIQGGPSAVGELGGDIMTAPCSSVPDAAACAIIINPATAGSGHFTFCTSPGGSCFVFRTMNHSILASGIFWISDEDNQDVLFYAGHSRIEATGMNVRGTSHAYFENATMIVHTTPAIPGIAFYIVSLPVLTGTAAVYAMNSTWHVYGGVRLYEPNDFIDFGTSFWFVTGNWSSGSISHLNNPANGRVYFMGTSRQVIKGVNYPSAGPVLGVGYVFLPNVYLMGSTKEFLTRFSTLDVHLFGNATWLIDPGAVYTVIAGSTLFIPSGGRILWSGNKTKQVTLTSNRTWRVDSQGQNYVMSYMSVKNSEVGLGGYFDVCVGGEDLGGNSGWNMADGVVCGLNRAGNDFLFPFLGLIIFFLVAIAIILFLGRGFDFASLEYRRKE